MPSTRDTGTALTSARATGTQGEDAACVYLQNNGYRILERNTRFGRYEIDVVAEDLAENMIVFVEVKTRASHSEQYPIHTAVNARKRSAMRRAIAHWVVKHAYDGPGRIDIVCVHGGKIVEHLKAIGSDFH